MKNNFRKIAAVAAAVMIAGTMSIGASALDLNISPVHVDTEFESAPDLSAETPTTDVAPVEAPEFDTPNLSEAEPVAPVAPVETETDFAAPAAPEAPAVAVPANTDVAVAKPADDAPKFEKGTTDAQAVKAEPKTQAIKAANANPHTGLGEVSLALAGLAAAVFVVSKKK